MGGFFVADFPSSLPNFRIYFWKGEILREAELLIYNGGFFCSQLAVKITRFLNSFLEQWNFEGGPCYWYITRGLFLWLTPRQIWQTSEFIFGRVSILGGLIYWYIMRGLFPSQDTAARNPAWWVPCSGKLCHPPRQGTPHKELQSTATSETRNPA